VCGSAVKGFAIAALDGQGLALAGGSVAYLRLELFDD
jgi:hypothetical protein